MRSFVRDFILVNALALATAVNAYAAQVLPGQSWGGSTPLYEKAQATLFVVHNVPDSVNSAVKGAILELFAKGDYSRPSPSESLSWYIEDAASGIGRPSAGTLIGGNSSDDVEWKQKFSIGRAELLRVVEDGTLEVTLVNSSEVNIGFDSSDYNSWILMAVATPVPLPGAVCFGLSGFVWLLVTKRRIAVYV